MICSGAMVFLDSCSHISFASEDIRCINSSPEWRVSPPARVESARVRLHLHSTR